ncbi:unnamed protein product [Medioppia subpectinata]|uniref:Uncharacterized protein n=1 Tax=Medioppia subpectinata TaxID=1979941 RepID=A0A7R9KBB3_9ACAR|nr:unnamed protein product [Medioppia subpectinata]CAG2100263.1 unnamed protein product [Medioppia subpectinata]
MDLCTENQFTCNSGQCIPIESFCDSHKHCGDGSDEPDGCNASINTSAGCKAQEYQCKNSRCLASRTSVCDGIDNCGDNSDEIDCKPQQQSAFNRTTTPQMTASRRVGSAIR